MQLPNRPLYDFELARYAKQLKIPYFRGVFMRDTLPKSGPHKRECGIVNLDTAANAGTHWVAYNKINVDVEYFDSFGNLKPPKELVRYLRNATISYNNDPYQTYNQVNCGKLCLEFLPWSN